MEERERAGNKEERNDSMTSRLTNTTSYTTSLVRKTYKYITFNFLHHQSYI